MSEPAWPVGEHRCDESGAWAARAGEWGSRAELLERGKQWGGDEQRYIIRFNYNVLPIQIPNQEVFPEFLFKGNKLFYAEGQVASLLL